MSVKAGQAQDRASSDRPVGFSAMLPEVSGRRAVDLGCGFGWFCRWARQNGAASVLGLDVSEKLDRRGNYYSFH